jgi:hypothetical protein
MKKIIISIISVLLLLVIVLTFQFCQKKVNPTSNPNVENGSELPPTVTPLPQTSTPSANPTVTVVPTEQNSLYPAFQNINGEKLYGYIDETGDFVIQPSFDHADDFEEGAAVVIDNLIYKVIDTKGTAVFESDNTIRSFHNGLAAFATTVDNQGLYGYIDPNGQVIIEPQFLMADDFGENGQAFVSTAENEYAVIDKTGKIIKSFPLETPGNYICDFKDGYLIYNNIDNGKFGVLSINGDKIFEPIYNQITYLGKGLFAFKDPKLELYEVSDAPAAIFNQKGEQLTDYTLYDISIFHGDYASATDNTSTYFIGVDGKEVTTLPRFEGRGTLILKNDIIKAELDQDLLYSKKDKTILWKNNNLTVLTPSITVKEVKFKPTRTVCVYYPLVEGLEDKKIQDIVNTQLKSIFTDSRNELTAEDKLSVEDSFQAILINQLLVISKSGYDYPSGAAHGMPIMDYHFIDITTGEFYELSDLFKADSNYKEKLNELIRVDMEEKSKSGDSMFFPETFEGISDKQYFHVTKDVLTIYFYPYDIAAYAAGFPEFVIPFEELGDYLNTEGAFWKSFH